MELGFLSILDGWRAEAYDGLNGFAIGTGETHLSIDVHDSRDGEALVKVLTEEVIPLYYDCDGLPRNWISRMKCAIRTLGWRFSADRMVKDYGQQAYIPAAGGTSSDAAFRKNVFATDQQGDRATNWLTTRQVG